MDINTLAAHRLCSMTVWEPQGVCLALGEQVRGFQARPSPFQAGGLPEGNTVPPTRVRPRSLCSQPLLGPLQIHHKKERDSFKKTTLSSV